MVNNWIINYNYKLEITINGKYYYLEVYVHYLHKKRRYIVKWKTRDDSVAGKTNYLF